MFNATKSLALVPILAMLGCATGPSGESFDSPIGKWRETHESRLGATKSSTMNIVDERNATFTGSPPGKIVFFETDDPRSWKGYWIIENGGNACAEEKGGSVYWGVQVFEFNEDYDRFTGYWDSCGEGQRYSSNGYR